MTTRIVSGGPTPLVEPTRTAPRVTPSPSQPFSAVMQAGAAAVLDGAERAVQRLPGGPVLAAAFRSDPGARPVSEAPRLGTTRQFLATDSTAEGPTLAGGEPGHDAGTLGGDALAQNTEQNLYYLKLQEQISSESRHYTALSNVLKARHDMLKNAIGNIR